MKSADPAESPRPASERRKAAALLAPEDGERQRRRDRRAELARQPGERQRRWARSILIAILVAGALWVLWYLFEGLST